MGMFSEQDRHGDTVVKWGSVVKLILLPIALIAFFFLAVNPIVIIGPTDRGVMVTLGKVEENVLLPGVAFKAPFIQDIRTYSITPNEYVLQIGVGQNGAITSDNQTIGVKASIYWAYDPSQIISMARQYDRSSLETILKSTAETAIKSVIGRYTIFDIAKNQTKLSGETLTEFKAVMARYPVLVNQLNLMNFDWSEQFDRNIEETQAKAQQVNQKEQELRIADFESQKQVKLAESERNAMIARAEGEKQTAILRAEAKKAEGEGIRAYNQSVAQNQSFELQKLQLEIDRILAEKWNGQRVPETQVVVPGFGTIQAK
jgi:regulator of protease activity HflC (stomatin/prohibitin superfamily)